MKPLQQKDLAKFRVGARVVLALNHRVGDGGLRFPGDDPADEVECIIAETTLVSNWCVEGFLEVAANRDRRYAFTASELDQHMKLA